MKFAKYLDNAQAPEWKRAYIDYRGLKKRIKAIELAERGENDQMAGSVSSDSEHGSLSSPSVASKWTHPIFHRENSDGGRAAHAHDKRRTQLTIAEAPDGELELEELRADGKDFVKTPSSAPNQLPAKQHPGVVILEFTPFPSRGGRLAPFHRGSQFLEMLRRRSSRFIQSPPIPIRPPTLAMFLERMPPVQLAFIQKLNSELSKVEAFFIKREAEAHARSLRLKEQLKELKDHRRLFHGTYRDAKNHNTPLPFLPAHRLNASRGKVPEVHWSRNTSRTDEGLHRQASATKLLPEGYVSARKKLKRAVAEYYRGLEVLNNYRILNITGFRKALKKFEKVTRVPLQDVYMKEKVDQCSFTSDQTVQALLKEAEDHFTTRFAQGDRDRALNRLRTEYSQKTHHFSTFRTGVALGLAIPAFVEGVICSFQERTRAEIPAWGSLLYIYAVFFVPTLFAFLVGTNLLVWTASRINYVFIFEFDIRTHLDHREYFEIPCVLLSTLCLAFWFSFGRVMESTVEPSTWPLIWLLFVLLFMINPLPVMSRESRWWFVRKFGRVLTSGFHRVEFADFWLGDQLCSLAFSLKGIYFVGCSYVVGFHFDQYKTCSEPGPWGLPFILGALPLIARFLQSIRRWWETCLIIHLINGGKYFIGILSYLFYNLWQHNGSNYDSNLVLFCFFGTISSLYALSWDLLVDWSVLRPRARFVFLRDDLIYSGYIPFYYIAIITDIFIRFIWVIYLPTRGPISPIRASIVALLEMLRRCQWNIYRLESEHIGNMDQYRITREVPLPYSFDKPYDSDEDGVSRSDSSRSGRSINSRAT